METKETLDVFETFEAFNGIARFAGFVPFRVKNKTIHERSVYYTTFFSCLYASGLLAACYLGQQEPDAEESLLVRYGNYTIYLQFIVLVVFVVLFNYLKRQQMANCLLAMHHFDCAMEVCGTNER
jgi:hypothetical protein